MPILSRCRLLGVVVALYLLLGGVPRADAQLVLPFVPELDDIPIHAFSYAGFVDGAVPQSQLRLRVEGAYDRNRPTRAEYFMPGEGRFFRGLPLAEQRVDSQELHAYGEYAFSERFSLFLDAPVRFLDPTINLNHSGAGDLQVGLKYAFFQQGSLTATAQIRAYLPTGDEDNGLGTGHPSAEPGLLFLWEPSSTWRVESEVQAWIPINHQRYGSEIVRYGVALSYGERDPESFWFTPVVEGQGWYVIRGRETVFLTPRTSRIDSSRDDTILNGNVGVRAGWGSLGDLYVGYSRALTGEVWYKEMYRVELRWFY